MTFYAGLDLAQQSDHTALVVLQRVDPHAELRPRPRDEARSVYRARLVKRLDTGIPYTDMVARIDTALSRPPLKGCTTLVIDATGVGRPVADLFSGLGRSAQSVTITGGQRANRNGSEWSVPKHLLASTVQRLLQTGRLQFSERVPHSTVLKQEMKDFRVKVSDTGHVRFEHREGKHDDLVLATALAAWYAEQGGRHRRAWGQIASLNRD